MGQGWIQISVKSLKSILKRLTASGWQNSHPSQTLQSAFRTETAMIIEQLSALSAKLSRGWCTGPEQSSLAKLLMEFNREFQVFMVFRWTESPPAHNMERSGSGLIMGHHNRFYVTSNFRRLIFLATCLKQKYPQSFFLKKMRMHKWLCLFAL